MTLKLWNCESCSKLQKTLTKKRRLEASWGRLWTFLKTFRLPKAGQLFGRTLVDMFNIKLKPKYKWKRIKKPRNSQFTISSISLSVCQFFSSLFLFTSKRPLTSMEWLCSLRVTAKYRPLFCQANFQTIWLRKEKKSGMFCCQINRTSELCYVRDFVLRQTNIYLWGSNN